jgi:5'-deoxynucleotidase
MEEALSSYLPYVKAADKLSALIKCIEERKAGNKDFDSAFSATLGHQALTLPEAREFIEEYLPAYSLNIDDVEKYN